MSSDALLRGRALLRDARNPDGSLGYLPGQAGAVEPTLLAIAAGLEPPWEWIAAQELSFGFLLLPAVAWTLDPTRCQPAVDWIVQSRGEPVEGDYAHDATIPAWSWVPGTAPWVEPTSWAVLSLRRCGQGEDRLHDGIAMIRDRQCSDGGWNYGNKQVKGTDLIGQPGPTGWATLALPDGAEVEGGLSFLAKSPPSTLTLALTVLAHHAHGRSVDPFLPALIARVGQRPRLDWLALAVAALSVVEEGTQPFIRN